MEIPSYGKILVTGHKQVLDIYQSAVVIQEKIDGSQFSAMHDEESGLLLCRSKGQQIYIENPDNLFLEAVNTFKELHEKGLLIPGYIYRGECLKKPKHNALCYDRVPAGNVILFDVERFADTPGDYFNTEDLKAEAVRLGLESVPVLFEGKVDNPKDIVKLLDNTSILGGQKIEGIVIKNYDQVSFDGKLMKAKLVSDDFKEVHRKEWNGSNPSGKDKLSLIIESLRTAARVNKAIIHLDERGELDNSPKDIGPIMKEMAKDILEEEEEYIKQELFNFYKKDIIRGVSRGVPEYYKRKLAGIESETIDWKSDE